MAHNHSPFLSLPTELRGIIFEFYSPRDRLFYFHHLFQQSRAANAKRKSKGEADGMYQAFAEDPRRPRDHAVAFVCKQVYCEYAVTQNILDNLFHVVNIAAPIMSASDAISLVTSQDGAGLPDLCKATKVRIRVDFLSWFMDSINQEQTFGEITIGNKVLLVARDPDEPPRFHSRYGHVKGYHYSINLDRAERNRREMDLNKPPFRQHVSPTSGLSSESSCEDANQHRTDDQHVPATKLQKADFASEEDVLDRLLDVSTQHGITPSLNLLPCFQNATEVELIFTFRRHRGARILYVWSLDHEATVLSKLKFKTVKFDAEHTQAGFDKLGPTVRRFTLATEQCLESTNRSGHGRNWRRREIKRRSVKWPNMEREWRFAGAKVKDLCWTNDSGVDDEPMAAGYQLDYEPTSGIRR